MRVGNYELVTQLASGGMAETHIARSVKDNSIVVIKQLLPRYAGNIEFIDMFVDEGRVISSLKHPNVVSLREFGFSNELPFLAMEYLHGVDLRTLTRTLALRRKRQMPIDIALLITISMCAGLHHAHEARTIDGKPMEIAHRDVSPQNVVLTFDGQVKLIDFGIATARGRAHETRSGALKGKIPYMAPEQVRAAATDRRTDVYATGVVLYELLTSRRPYIGKRKRMGEFSMMMAIVNHDVVPADAIRTEMPPSLTKVVTKAMELDPARRYQTAADLEFALRDVARKLGLVLTPARLSLFMADTLGEHKTQNAAKTNKEILQLVSEVGQAKTTVDEAHDPSTLEASEVNPSFSILTTDKIPATDKSPPMFAEAVDVDVEPVAELTVPVEKTVEANVTRLRFQHPIQTGFRWARLLEGIEGVVEIDFAEAGDLAATAVAAASVALHGVGTEVSEIRLIAVPIGLATQLDDRCNVVSVSCPGICPQCNTASKAVLSYDELRERLATGETIPCCRCGAGLVDIELAPLASFASRNSIMRPIVPPLSELVTGNDQVPIAFAPTASIPIQPEPVEAAPRRRSAIHPTRSLHRTWLPTYAGVAILALAVAITVLARASRKTKVTGSIQVSAEGRTWEQGDLWIVEVNGDGSDDDAAAFAARRYALRLLLTEIEGALSVPIRARVADVADETAISNFTSHEDSRRLVLVSSLTERAGGRSKVTTQYMVAKSDIARAQKFYEQRSSAWGVVLINAPPSRSPGVLVLEAPAGSPVAAGDRLISAGGEPLTSLASLTPRILEQQQLSLVVERVERKNLAVRAGEP